MGLCLIFQNADDLFFGESRMLLLWSFRLGQSLSQTEVNLGGNVTCRDRKAHPAAYATDADLSKAQHPLPAKGHKTYPSLLGGLRIDRANQICCADITYLLMRKRLSVFGRHHGLVHPQGFGVAHLEHA